MARIYLDEAGTDALAPVSVVVGVIVHDDTQCDKANKLMCEILETIPEQFRRKHPIFHATTIWRDKEFRDIWTFDQRLKLLTSVMSIPRHTKMAIALGARRRVTGNANEPFRKIAPKFSNAEIDHILAFNGCIGKADAWMRQFAKPDEYATVIAEDTDIKTSLKRMTNALKEIGYSLPTEKLIVRNTLPSKETGIYRISRIRLPIHFVKKADGRLLQIADACAWGFRRLLAGLSFGNDFGLAICGRQLDLSPWKNTFDLNSTFHWADKYPITAKFGSVFHAQVA